MTEIGDLFFVLSHCHHDQYMKIMKGIFTPAKIFRASFCWAYIHTFMHLPLQTIAALPMPIMWRDNRAAALLLSDDSA
jgi:hypothetical protein